jgi:hypothetical protein
MSKALFRCLLPGATQAQQEGAVSLASYCKKDFWQSQTDILIEFRRSRSLFVYFQLTCTLYFSSKASSITAAHPEEEDLLLLDPDTTLLDQVDGACESKPFQSKLDIGCFGKKPKPTHHSEASSSGSFSEGSDADGPIRMVSAKPTYNTQSTFPLAETARISPTNDVTLAIEPATPTSATTTISPPQTSDEAMSKVHDRRGSGFPFHIMTDKNEAAQSASASFESTRAVRRPTDPSTLSGSFDSTRSVRRATDPSIAPVTDDSDQGPDEAAVSRFQTAMD